MCSRAWRSTNRSASASNRRSKCANWRQAARAFSRRDSVRTRAPTWSDREQCARALGEVRIARQALPTDGANAPTGGKRQGLFPGVTAFEPERQRGQIGSNVLARLAKYESLGKRFQPTEQMRQLAASGKGFFPA